MNIFRMFTRKRVLKSRKRNDKNSDKSSTDGIPASYSSVRKTTGPDYISKGENENPASLVEPKNSDESETNSPIVRQTGDFDVGFSSFINHIDALPYLASQGENSTGGGKNSHFYPGDNDSVSTHRRRDYARRDKHNFTSSLFCENDSKDGFLVRSDSDNYSCRNSFTESLKFSSKCGLSSRGSSPFEYKPAVFVGGDDDIPGSVTLNRNELKGLVTSIVRATLDSLISDGRVCLSDADIVSSLQNKMEILEKRFEELSRAILSVDDEVEHRIEWHIRISIYYSNVTQFLKKHRFSLISN